MLKMKRHELIRRIVYEAALPEAPKHDVDAQSFTRVQLLELFLYIVNSKNLISLLKQRIKDNDEQIKGA